MKGSHGARHRVLEGLDAEFDLKRIREPLGQQPPGRADHRDALEAPLAREAPVVEEPVRVVVGEGAADLDGARSPSVVSWVAGAPARAVLK